MKKIKICFLLLALTACASNSGVLKMGHNTYTISTGAAPAFGGIIGAKKTAYAEANKECEKQGKEMVVQSESSERTTRAGAGNVDLTFKCLDKNDPELKTSPVFRKSPDIIIEDRRN